MKSLKYDIEIVSAPSILGLTPTGVEYLGERLLAAGLAEKLQAVHPVIHVPTLNALYSDQRDDETKCLNPSSLKDFSLTLGEAVSSTIGRNRFAFVLGGDCSILLGIMSALKAKGTYGLIFLDAHADFYEPEKSTTGQVADMDLAIVTGRGPAVLTNIHNLRPYVKDENVIHVGQRDWEETKKFGSADIRETTIKCIDLATIENKGVKVVATEVLEHIKSLAVEGFWVHFDTDILSDEINPAVEYRLPGGLQFEQVEYLIKNLLLTGRMVGISVTIFNPKLDRTGAIPKSIAESLGRAFDLRGH
jgi:arginase